MKFRDNQNQVFIVAVIIVVMLVFLNLADLLKPFKESSYWLFKYPQIFISKAGFSFNNTFGFISNWKDLGKKNSELTDENERLKRKISELKEVKHENELLRSVLNLPMAKERTLVDAAVIGKDPYGFSSYLIINRGSDSRLEAGMNVVDSNGFFVGRITEVSSTIAKIRTVMDNSSSISAIDQESRVQGIVKKDLNEGLIFDMVAQDEKVDVGDTIITLLAGNINPEPIAAVSLIEKYPNKPFQKIKLAPLADIKRIEKVFVIIK